MISKQVKDIEAQLLKEAEPKIQAARKAYAVSLGRTMADIQKIQDTNELPFDFIITLNNGTTITVADIWNNPEMYHNMSIRDPMEPKYGKDKAKIFVNKNELGQVESINIHSFAHGGRKYYLDQPPEIMFADVPDSTAAFKQIKPFTTTLQPVLDCPVDVLPIRLRDWIVDEAERMGCPVDFIAVGALVTLSSLLGKKLTIKPKQYDDWNVAGNLWCAFVGRPSTKKSPSLNKSTQFINEIENQNREDYKTALAEYEINQLAHEITLKAEQKKANKSESSAQMSERLNEVIKRAPKEPKLERLTINSTTVEKAQMIMENNPNGFLMIHDELSGWLSRHSKDEYSEDRAFYLTSFNGDQSFSVDRVTRKAVYIENCICSVLGGIQPSKLSQFMSGVAKGVGANDDGLFQRFQLLVYPDFTIQESIDRAPNQQAKDLAREVFNKFYNFEKTAFGSLNFDDEAQQLFNDYDRNIRLKAVSETNVGIEAHLGKYPSLMASLSLIFYLADVDKVNRITADAAESAIAFCNYLESHARRIYSIGDSVDDRAKAFCKKLDMLNDGFTVRDIVKKNWSGLSDKEQVCEAINKLIEHGYLSEVSQKNTTGRPTNKYNINPEVKN